MTQLITFPTHNHGNTLDLLITSAPHNILKLSSREPLIDTCDHNMINFTLNLTLSKTTKIYPKRNFYRANYDLINNYLSECSLDQIFTDNTADINAAYSQFINIIHNSIKLYVPLYKTHTKSRLPKNIKNMLNLKKQLYKRTKFDPTSKLLYKELCKCYKKAVNLYFSNIEQEIITTSNKKSFYSYINRKLKSRSTLPPLVDTNDKIVIDPYEKANLLNTHFSSIFQHDNLTKPSLSPLNFPTNLLPSKKLVITNTQTIQAISKLKGNVSTTPDQVPALFIKRTCSTLSTPMTQLFNLSLNQGLVPHIWKKAEVIPIPKNKGVRSNPASQRPISLTSPFCRIMEVIVHDDITDYLMNNNLISTVQHGFIKFRSTQTQHIDLLDKITVNYEQHTASIIIYLDFSKAFDSVPHSKLIYTLKHFKINTQIVNWITDYLSNRTQQTVVEGCKSSPCAVTSGVPQGSVLGPLLFVLYLEDLIRKLQSIDGISVYVFADDLKILSTNPSSLQKALDVVNNWSINWQLPINPSKSEQIIFCRHPISPKPTFTINNSIIPIVNTIKDLGVILSDNLKWNPHIQKIYSKSISLLYLTLKSFCSTDPFFYVNLYKLYIRPNLEYNVCTWNPFQRGDVKRIESVQEKFTRFLCKKCHIKYNNYLHRLDILHLETLEIRRVKQDMILIYKMLNNLIDLNFSKYFSLHTTVSTLHLRRHRFYIKLPKFSKTSARNNFFNYRCISAWNKLPDDVVSSNSLSIFKSKLNKVNFDNIINITNF